MTSPTATDVSGEAQDKRGSAVSFVNEEEAPSMGAPAPSSSKKSGLGLSVVSRMYDRGGKGYLDPVEQSLRDLDDSGRGDLVNEKAYIIMQSLHREQKKNVTLKKLLFALGGFAVVMSLAVLGLSFAAASLAKDTSVSKSATGANLMTKDGSSVVGTKPVAGMQLDIAMVEGEPCINIADLSAAYSQVKSGSTVSVVTKTGTGAETARTLSEGSVDGKAICLGSLASDPMCFNFATSCGGGDRRLDEERHLERTEHFKKQFRELVEGGPSPMLRERSLGPCLNSDGTCKNSANCNSGHPECLGCCVTTLPYTEPPVACAICLPDLCDDIVCPDGQQCNIEDCTCNTFCV